MSDNGSSSRTTSEPRVAIDYLRRFGHTREDAQLAADTIEVLIDEIERLRDALEWIAHFDDAHMETARTLHHDMRGRAREALRE